MQTVHEVQRLWPINRWPVRRVPTIHAILKKYRKYRQHGTSLNKNKQWEISLVFSYVVIKGKLKTGISFHYEYASADIMMRIFQRVKRC